jgi:2-polyprenyl-6-methoxyphenol hydroxylase-like FAD-dependent oxidoreductase
VRCRIIDAADAPSPYSKALAVNPRTLEILEPTGITEQMLSIGMRVIRGCFWKEDHIVAEIAIDQLQHKYPFMLALSQRQTVPLLEEALNRFDVHVERSAKLVHCRQTVDGVEAEVEIAGKSQSLQAPWLLAADGARSTVRHELGIEFAGSSFEHPWFLMDVPLKTNLPENAAHIRTLAGGGFRFLFAPSAIRSPPPIRFGA